MMMIRETEAGNLLPGMDGRGLDNNIPYIY
jgi:hypothetical protein